MCVLNTEELEAGDISFESMGMYRKSFYVLHISNKMYLLTKKIVLDLILKMYVGKCILPIRVHSYYNACTLTLHFLYFIPHHP